MPMLLPVPPIEIGAGRIEALGDHVAALAGAGASVLLVADPGLRAVGVTPRIETALAPRAARVTCFEAFGSDPKEREIDAAASLARAAAAGLVVGIGGGSALDVAKLAAAVAAGRHPAAHYQFARAKLPRPLPVVAVPTTAGTGSETTTTAVFTNEAGKKAWAWDPELRAALVVLDPTLTTSLPPGLTAQTGIDALVHAVEAATNRNRSAANDIAALAAIRLVRQHLQTAVREPANLAAREGMLLASCLAGIAINNAGTAIAHCVAHALGSLGRIHHGRAAGLGLRASLGWNIAGEPPRWKSAAEAFGAPELGAFPGAFDAFLREIGVKVAVADEFPELTPARLAAEMAGEENASMRRSNPREAGEADLLALARHVLAAA